MSQFRTYVWDPALLVSQMACMQSIFYTVYSGMLLTASTVFGYNTSMAQVFTLQPSRLAVLAQLASALACAYALSVFVQRAKQCLDFSCTLHFFHLIALLLYTHVFPSTISWWLLQLSSITLCTVLGEYLCMKVESQEIKLVGQASKYDL